MNKLFITLVLLLSMAFGSLFYIAKCGHCGDAIAGGAIGSFIGSSLANNVNRREVREVEVVERPSSISSSRIEGLEDEVSKLRKKVRALERKIEKLAESRED